MSEPFTLVTSDRSDDVSMRTALIALALIIGVVGFAITGALYFNQQRRKAVVEQYTKETTQLISTNTAAATALFSQTFDDCKKALEQQQKLESTVEKSTDIICPTAVEALTKLDVNRLKDSSSIAYVRISNSSYELLEASGKYNQLRPLQNGQPFSHFSYSDEIRADLVGYLEHQQDITLWQDFITYIGGKEVIVPVVIDGRTLGYIFRGVIER